ERWTGAPQIAARHRRGLANDVVHRRPGSVAKPRHTGHNLHPAWHLPPDEERLARRRGPLFDDLQLEQARRADDLLGAVHVGDAGQLHQDLIAVAALLRNARLRDTEIVHPALNRLARLDDGFLAQLLLLDLFHRERVRPVGSRVAVEVSADLVGGLPERRVLIRTNAFDLELRDTDRHDAGHRDLGRHELFAQPLRFGLRL